MWKDQILLNISPMFYQIDLLKKGYSRKWKKNILGTKKNRLIPRQTDWGVITYFYKIQKKNDSKGFSFK